jgi:hypothetical protein
MLARTISLQGLQPVARRRTQVVEAGGCIDHIEFAQGNCLNSLPLRRTTPVAEQALRGLVGEAADYPR